MKGLPISGTLKPGKETALHTADTAQNIELGKPPAQGPFCCLLCNPRKLVSARNYGTEWKNRKHLSDYFIGLQSFLFLIMK